MKTLHNINSDVPYASSAYPDDSQSYPNLNSVVEDRTPNVVLQSICLLDAVPKPQAPHPRAPFQSAEGPGIGMRRDGDWSENRVPHNEIFPDPPPAEQISLSSIPNLPYDTELHE